MKKLLTLLLASIVFYGCQEDFVKESPENAPATRAEVGSSEYYYWCDGVKIPLTINKNKLFVLAETTKYENVSKLAANSGSKMENARTINDYASLGIESSSKNTKMQTSLTSFTLDNANLKAVNSENVVYIAPYFKTSDGADLGITNVFSVQLKGNQDLVKLQKIAEEYNVEILGENRFDPSIFYLSCAKESKGNALEMANLMYESGEFEYAAPEFLVESSAATNDDYFNSQWNLYNSINPLFDINYVEAMNDFSFPNIDNVIVAVVDNGIYDNHDDLPLHNVSYNAHTGGSTSGLYGNHGTLVAGVIGATANNIEGIAGVASGVKIMPISIVYSADATRLGISASTSTHFANAIRFAANNGARVINNSWSFGNSTSPDPDVNNAITYAHGKGCVVVFASGNDHPTLSVKQPQAGAPSSTLVVGAFDRNGNRADFSGYGSSLDVVAPGTEIWTTTWIGGYSNPSGTSFATPHVSAIAALILSENPALTQQRVVDIIEQSARKVNPASYNYIRTSGRPNGTWNSQVGYGLVDAHAAVSKAEAPPSFGVFGGNRANSSGDMTFTTNIPPRSPLVSHVSWYIFPTTGVRSITPSFDGRSCVINFQLSLASFKSYTVTATASNSNGTTEASYSFLMDNQTLVEFSAGLDEY
jgi:subtilisin family serine protease